MPIKASDGATLYNSEYARHGVAQLYAPFEQLAGRRDVQARAKAIANQTGFVFNSSSMASG